MYKYRIKDARKEYFQSQDETVLVVDVEVIDDDEVLDFRSFAFPLSISKEEVDEQLDKFIKNYYDEAVMAVKNAEQDKINKESDLLINQLKPSTIKEDSEKTKEEDSEDEV